MILQNKKLGIFIIFLLFCFSAFSQEAVAKAVDSINKTIFWVIMRRHTRMCFLF